MDDAVTPFPIPESTPPVTTTILRSESRVSATRDSSMGGRLARRPSRRELGYAQVYRHRCRNCKCMCVVEKDWTNETKAKRPVSQHQQCNIINIRFQCRWNKIWGLTWHHNHNTMGRGDWCYGCGWWLMLMDRMDAADDVELWNGGNITPPTQADVQMASYFLFHLSFVTSVGRNC